MIQRIPILMIDVDDKPRWQGKEVAKLSVKHVYKCLKNMTPAAGNGVWSWIWKLEVQTKTQA